MASTDQREYFTYETGKGTLVGFMPEKGQNIKVYCSRCSMDTEMYPEAYFTTTKSSWKLRRSVPCGCSKAPRYTKHQWITKIKRKLNSLGRTLIGVDFSKGVNNKARVYYLANSSVKSTSINALTNGNHEVIDLNKIPDSCIDFFSQDQYTFIRSESGTSYYKCKVCEKGRYFKEGLCNGLFKTSNSKLSEGKGSCWCNKCVRKTPDQWRSDVKYYLRATRLDGVCLNIEDITQSHSQVKWQCNKCNHLNSTPLGGLPNIKSCISCHQQKYAGLYGYYKNRLDENDYLYLINVVDKGLFKIGRSFMPQTRLLNLSGLCGETLEIVHLWEGSHEDVFKVEQEVLKKFKSYRVRTCWTTELLLDDVREQVVSYLNNKNEVQLYVQ